jgi:thiol-disulfide isomerase/thioredoxin
MRRNICLALILLNVGCQYDSKDESKVAGNETRQPRRVPRPILENPETDLTRESSDSVQESQEGSSITIKMGQGLEGAPMAPRYSPPGKRLELKATSQSDSLGIDGLEAEMMIGWPLDKQKPIQLLVTRPVAGEAYNKLFIDANADGVLDEEPIIAIQSESRGNFWSNFTTTVKANYFVDSPISEDYPVAFWIAVASKGERPEFIRFSRRGFKTGEVTIGDQKVTVVLSDSNNDAVFGDGDWWELRSGETASSKGIGNRTIGDFHWLGESAYKFMLNDATGNSGQLKRVDPGKTREQDELDRDPYGADRLAIKAEKPLDFRHDFDEAMAEALANNKRCFIKFETTWCGPCKTMTQLVFTAKDVVDASHDVVCIKVDGDERKDLVEKFAVKAYPTGVLLSGSGAEESRYVGYQRVVEMAKFLKGPQK